MSNISDIFGYQSPFLDYDIFTNRPPDDVPSLTVRKWKITSGDLLRYFESGEVSRNQFFTYFDNDTNAKYTTGDTFLFHTFIYTSTDAIKLYKIYQSISPGEDEVLVFIEDNSSDSSSQKHYIKIGSGIKKELESNINYADYAQAHFNKIGITVDEDDYAQINELIKNSVVELSTIERAFSLLKLTTAVSLSLTINQLNSIISGIRSLKIESKYWNPNSGDLKNEKYFEPYFFPIIKLDRKTNNFVLGTDGKVIELNNLVDSLFNSIDSKIEQTKMELSKDESGFVDFVDPLKLRYIPLTINQYVLEALREILKFLNDFVGESLLFFNAIFCGFVNSIIEIIAGFFELVSLFFKVSSALFSIKNFDEYYDNLIQAIGKVDFKKVFAEFRALAGEVFPKIIKSIANKVLDISKEEIGYFIGYVIGLVLEFMLTSGVGTVKSIISKGTKAIGTFFEIIFEFIESIFKKRSTKLDKLQAFSEFLGMGTDEVVNAVKELRRKLNKFLELGALKHLDQVDYDSYTLQKQFIKDVESGKQSIDPGNRTDGTDRNDGDNTLKGNYGECKMTQHILEKSARRYKPVVKLNDDPYKKFPIGIDGVFENLDFIPPPPPAKFIICEAKYSKDGRGGLSTTETKTGLQMSPRWIKQRLRAQTTSDVYDDILKTYLDSKGTKIRNFNSVLFKIDEKGKVKYAELSFEKTPKELKNNFEI